MTRALALGALLIAGQLQAQTATAPAESPERRAARIADLLRRDCADGAGQIEGHEVLTPALRQRLLRCCRSDRPNQQSAALAAAGRLIAAGQPSLAPDLTALFEESRSDEVRIAVLAALADRVDSRLTPQLRELFLRVPARTAPAVISAIGHVGSADDLLAIADKLGNDLESGGLDPGAVEVRAVQTLVERNERISVGLFRQRWPKGTRQLRVVALLVFGSARELAAVPVIVKALAPLDDVDPDNQAFFAAAFWALARVSDRESLDQLRAFAFARRDTAQVQSSSRVHPNVRPEYLVQVRLSALRALAEATPGRDLVTLAGEIRSSRTSNYGSVADTSWAAGVDTVLAELEKRYGAPLP